MMDKTPCVDVVPCDDFYARIGLADPQGNPYRERAHKYGQLHDYAAAMRAVLKKCSTKRPLTLVDCGCGRSYLSFYLNAVLAGEGRKNLSFVGIDTNAALIAGCRDTARALGYSNMAFYEGSILSTLPMEPADIVYSLHACGAATDQTLYRGVASGARYILSVSCCQHGARAQMKGHPLRSVSRHTPYKERLADMAADALRALLLEMWGYRVDIFEFTASANTPKNIMLRAEKLPPNAAKTERAAGEYAALSSMMNIRPALEGYLGGLERSETARAAGVG